MRNISWGTKIMILFISFVILIGSMVFMSMQQNTDLVNEDYYENELKYQDRINEMNNANALSESVTHTILLNNVQIQFPSVFKGKNVTGEILFFRPSDKSKDYKTAIQLNQEAQQLIDTEHLHKGMYRMGIRWRADSKAYFMEEVIVIP